MNKAIEADIDKDRRADKDRPRRPGRSPATALANLLTYARLAAVPLIVACLLIGDPAGRWAALVLFVVAAITDYLDGYVARTRDQGTALGRMLDPIADKVLVATVLLMLAGDGTIAGATLVAAVIILVREILVSGLREFLSAIEVAVPVSRLAKWKTTIQLVALALLLAGEPGEAVVPGIVLAGTLALWIAALLTIVTGYDYMRTGISRLVAEDRT